MYLKSGHPWSKILTRYKMPEALEIDEAWLSVLLHAADQLIAQPDFISLLHDPADGYHVEAKQIVSALAALETCGADTPEKRALDMGLSLILYIKQ